MIHTLLLLTLVGTRPQSDTLVISLDDAVRRALAVSPTIASAIGAVHAPRGARREARWPFPDNPILEYGRARRQAPGGTSYDADWALSQEVEIAGQWIWRGNAAAALVRSSEARVDDARRLTALEVRRAYTVLSIAERRAALTDSAAAFGERLSDFARRQFDAGEVNRLEWNAAVLEAARARSAADRTRADLASAAADLGRLLALPGDTIPHTAGLPAIPTVQWGSDSALLSLARARRPDLLASEERKRSADQSFTAARWSFVPNVTVAAVGGHEAGTDQLLGFTVGIKVPLFHRQQATIGNARAERASAHADFTATEFAVQGDVLAAAAHFVRGRDAERRFATDVLRAATENVTLTERALAEGEVGVTDVLVLRGTAVAAQLEYLDILRDATNAWFELAAAIAADPADLTSLLETAK